MVWPQEMSPAPSVLSAARPEKLSAADTEGSVGCNDIEPAMKSAKVGGK